MRIFPDRFAIITDEVSQALERVVAFANRHQIPALELRSMFGRQFRELTDTDVEQIKRVVLAHRLEIAACATPVFKCHRADAQAIEEHRQIFLRAAEIALELRAPIIRVFSFFREDLPATVWAADVARHLNALQAICPTGVRIGLENEAACLAGTGPEVLALLDAGLDPRIGIIWDPCNVLYVEAPAPPLVDQFIALANRVIHIHVKDAVRHSSVGARPVGDGHVDWRTQFSAAAVVNYRGRFSLETHWRHRALDEKELLLPGGHRFSAGGEDASEICVTGIRRAAEMR